METTAMRAGLNKVICRVDKVQSTGAILVDNLPVILTVMTCSPELNFKNGQKAIVRPGAGFEHKISDELFLIVESEDILLTTEEQ